MHAKSDMELLPGPVKKAHKSVTKIHMTPLKTKHRVETVFLQEGAQLAIPSPRLYSKTTGMPLRCCGQNTRDKEAASHTAGKCVN